MANPLSFPNLPWLVADLITRVRRLERRRAAPVPDSLDDLRDTQILYGHSVSAPADGHVFTWDSSVSTPFGGAWVAAPSVAGDIAVTEALASYSDDGLFDETALFEFQPQFVVAANSHQLAIVTAHVDGISDSELVVEGTPGTSYGDVTVLTQTPWRARALDITPDPDGPIYGGMGSGAGRVSFPVWMHNDTDTEATHTLSIDVGAVASGGPEFDATVTVRAESVFQMAALTP